MIELPSPAPEVGLVPAKDLGEREWWKVEGCKAEGGGRRHCPVAQGSWRRVRACVALLAINPCNGPSVSQRGKHVKGCR